MPDKPPIILWGVITPSHFYFPRQFVESSMRLISYSQFQKAVTAFNIFYLSSPRTATNRNKALDAITVEDYVLMIDSDMEWKPNAIELMLETAKANPDAVITGLATLGKPPFRPNIYMWPDREDKKPTHIEHWPDEPFEIDAFGTVCLLIPKKIIEALDKHPFDHIPDYYPWGECIEDKELRHDLAFSKRVKEAGFKIICDPRVQLGHLRPSSITMEDWIRNRDFKPPLPPT